jgi:hypothetical protein
MTPVGAARHRPESSAFQAPPGLPRIAELKGEDARSWHGDRMSAEAALAFAEDMAECTISKPLKRWILTNDQRRRSEPQARP